MSFTDDWIKEHREGINFKCSCGATVNLKGWVEKMEFSDDHKALVFVLYARCWKCNKELKTMEHTMLIDMAYCNVIDNMIEKFKRDFNFDEKPKPQHICVVK